MGMMYWCQTGSLQRPCGVYASMAQYNITLIVCNTVKINSSHDILSSKFYVMMKWKQKKKALLQLPNIKRRNICSVKCTGATMGLYRSYLFCQSSTEPAEMPAKSHSLSSHNSGESSQPFTNSVAFTVFSDDSRFALSVCLSD